jgi:tRNA-2-methylthio-N6-dimethylallyladenosine synthase
VTLAISPSTGRLFSRPRTIGTTQKVLVEKLSKKSDRQVSGRTENNRWVNFDADPSTIGQFVDVIITEALPNSLRGRLVDSLANDGAAA